MSAARDGRFAPVLDVANAVLYEGYLLYPYTKSATKNRIRWQFGVVVPRAYLEHGTGESAEFQTEFFFRARAGEPATIEVVVRFLQVEARRVEALRADGSYEAVAELPVGTKVLLTFDEGVERELHAVFSPADGASSIVPLSFPDSRAVDEKRDGEALVGRMVRERWPLHGTLELSARALPGEPDVYRVTLRVQNESAVVEAEERSSALRTAFVSTHVLLGASGGSFASTQDPPAELAQASADLEQRGLYPVLAGEPLGDERYAGLLLASPIILYDYPKTAKNTTDQFDATEIDELLALSVLALSDEEREEARRTDPRAAAIVDRAESLDAAALGRVHAGALHRVDPFDDLDIPSFDCVFIDGVKVSRGAKVRIHPKRRADIWDVAIAEKIATVRAVHQDVENQLYVAVTIDDDPASDLHEWYGRSFFYYPEEIEPLEPAERVT